MKKRVLSMFMALALCLTLLPAAALAEGAEGGAAQIGDTVYSTLPEAVNAAKDGDTIKLLADYAGGEVTITKSVTLDLNGHEMDDFRVVQVNDAGETLPSGNLTVEDTSAGKTGKVTGTIELMAGKLTINGGTIGDGRDGVSIENGNLIVNGGAIDYLYGSNSGTVTITGGTIKNARFGEGFNITVTGGSGHTGLWDVSEGTWNISGGAFEGVKFLTASPAKNATISGGTFGEITRKILRDSIEELAPISGLLADGYAFYQKTDSGEYDQYVNLADTITSLENVQVKGHTHNFTGNNNVCTECGKAFAASVTQNGAVTYYKDFNTALAAAKAGDTLKLLKDVTGDVTVTIDKAITFDLNGHKIYALTVECKITLKDSTGGTGKIAEWLRIENRLTIGDLLEEGYALRNAETGAWYGATEQTVGNVTVQQVPITSVTLTALNADGTDASTSIPYGTTGGIKLSASCTRQGAGELSCQWYTIGGTLQLIDGATKPVYQLPADLSVGRHTYRVTFTADGYSKSADLTITVTNQIVPTGAPTLSAKMLTYGQALSAIKLSGKLHDNVNNKDVEGTFTWADGTVKPSAGSYEAAWKFTPADGDTYIEADGTVTITVNKAKPTGAPIYTKITAANKTLKDAALKPNTSWPTGTIQWVDKDGKELENTTEVKANTAYKWIFTPGAEFADNYTTAEGTVILYSVSTGGGSGSSSDRDNSGSTGKTETTTKPDGTTVKTETKPDGTKIQTETKKDGSTVKTETKKDGSSVTENKAANGSTGTVKTDKNGQTTAETALSSKAIEDAKKSGEPVKAPVEVEASRDSNTAPTVKVELPKGAGETKVEIPVSNVKPGTVAVLVHPDGTEEIVKNSLPTEDGIQLTVNGGATVKIVDNSKDFADTRNHWAKDAIDFVSARGLVNGMNDSIYAPNASTTRAQLWTILARQNDADLNGGNTWYEKAQLWSKEKGISDGTEPNAAINRAQMVTMLWRAAGQPTAGGTANFTDVPADSYYANAVSWAVEGGITAGVGGGRFDPAATCTRAQIATFLWRAMAE